MTPKNSNTEHGNPYLENHGVSFAGLLNTLMRNDWQAGALLLHGQNDAQLYNQEQLEAIAQQAKSIKTDMLLGIRAIGVALGTSQPDELDGGDAAGIGWLTSNLAALVSACDTLEANANDELSTLRNRRPR